jgi:hypothetical protein
MPLILTVVAVQLINLNTPFRVMGSMGHIAYHDHFVTVFDIQQAAVSHDGHKNGELHQ